MDSMNPPEPGAANLPDPHPLFSHCQAWRHRGMLRTGEATTEDIPPSCDFKPVELHHDVAAVLVPLSAHQQEILLLRDLRLFEPGTG